LMEGKGVLESKGFRYEGDWKGGHPSKISLKFQ
jgi:hypothetical protein